MVWFSLDLFPRYLDAVEMVRQSIASIKALVNILKKLMGKDKEDYRDEQFY